ncbi:unnamed protein product [Protopolystoma xenopodis]|uniref:Uncharacterized protein n=1 Tax=Protopolystoma xenopodis TaxID=117903 RepID=A0A3S5BZG4_9PLAT|nr:unnamed protein product [Protopolystoma xenopodis]
MAKLTDDVEYDADEMFENVPSRLSDAGNHDNYYDRRLQTRCVLHSRLDNKTDLRRRGQPTSIHRKKTVTPYWSSYLQEKLGFTQSLGS